MAKKVKLFVPYEEKITTDGIRITKYKLNPKLRDKNIKVKIKAIDVNTGRIDYKEIVEYSKHENLRMYKIESKYFDTFWVSSDHSLIVYDGALRTIRKASPREILANRSRYWLIKHDENLFKQIDIADFYPNDNNAILDNLLKQKCVLLNCNDHVSIEYDPSITVAYDLTVDDYYTFSTYDGVFVQDTAGVYFIDTKEARKEIFDKKMHTIYHIRYMQSDKYIHVFRHELLYSLYMLTSLSNKNKKPLVVNSLDEFEITFELLNDVDRPAILKQQNIKTTVGKLILNKILFDNEYLIDFTITKKNVQSVNDILYRYLKNKYPEYDEYNLNKLYLDKLHDVVVFLSNFVTYTKYVPSIKEYDYLDFDTINNDVRKLVDEVYIGKTIYEKIVDKAIGELEKHKDKSDLYKIYASGSRVSRDQLSQIIVARGYIANDYNVIINKPIKSNLLQGLSEKELFVSSFGARKGLIDKHEEVPKSGYLSRTMAMNSSFISVSNEIEDCNSDRYLNVKIFSELHAKTLIGRYYYDDKTSSLVKIDEEKALELYKKCQSDSNYYVKVRSPIYCKCDSFQVCKKCAGDFEFKMLGLLSGAFIAERMTQLILRTFHTSGSATIDIPEQLIELLDIDMLTKDGRINTTKINIDKLNEILDSTKNDNYKVAVDKRGNILINGHAVNKDIVTSVLTIKSYLTRSIEKIGKVGLYPEVVYHAIMKEYLRHGFIKSLYIETILSHLYAVKTEQSYVPIRYIDDIDWNNVDKLSIKKAGKVYSRFLYLVYEPNFNSLMNLTLEKDDKLNAYDPYYRLLQR